jgi:hypothetical protein
MHVPVRAALLLLAPFAVACATTPSSTPSPSTSKESLYPAQPPQQPSRPLADPPLQRPTLHLTITKAGLAGLLDALVPTADTGNYALLGARTWSWQRAPFRLAFDDAKKSMTARTDVTARVEVPGTALELVLQVTANVQPVLTAEHKLVLQAVDVDVTSADRRIKVAEYGAGLVAHVEDTLKEKLTTLAIDLRPMFQGLHEKLATPLFVPLGDATACFALDVRGLEAGPTILADGLEKELALTIAPSLTLPCTMRDASGQWVAIDPATPAPTSTSPLPPLKNSSGIEGGPFRLSVPIAAGYPELQQAMGAAFPDGKLFFTTDHPGLYIADPRISSSAGEVVVAVRVGGFVERGVRVDVDGDLFLAGRPVVRDNFLEFPDLKPTVETEQVLLKAAFALKEGELTAAVKRALRLDLSARLQSVKDKLTTALSMEKVVVEGVPPLCTQAELGRLEITDIAVHDPYLRATVATTALLSASLPCPTSTTPPPTPVATAPATPASPSTTTTTTTTTAP